MANGLDPIQNELDELDKQISSIASNLSTAFIKSFPEATDKARELTKEFSKGKDITKKIDTEMRRLKNSIESSYNLESKLNDELAKQLTSTKKSATVKAETIKKQILQLQLERNLNIELEYQYRELEKITEEKKKQSTLSSVINDKIKDINQKYFTTLGILKFILDAALHFNSVSVQIGKNLGYGADQADRVTKNMSLAANSSNNLNFTLKNAFEATSELNNATGGVAEYSADALETQIMLTKQFGLTGEEAAGIYKFSVLTSKSSSQVNKQMIAAFVNTRNAVKGSADFKKTMAEVAKISGQLAANFKNNPAAITAAVVKAQALGTTLEDAKEQGRKLLDFESSIEAELKAELLTGQQLNLERARAAALQGDQVTVMEELAKQGMTIEKFSNMNVLAQDAYAEALGTTSDKLSEQLKKQKIASQQGKSLAQLTKEETAEAQKRQNIQDKFNASILKLQDFIGNLVAGPVGALLESLSKGLEYIAKITGLFGKIFSFINSIPGVGKLLSGIASAATVAALIALVTNSLTKGTFLNPMIVKDVGGGGGIGDMLGGTDLTKGRGGMMGRLSKAYKGGGIKGATKSAGRMLKQSKGLTKLAKGTGALALLGTGADLVSNLTDENRSTGNALAKTLDQNKFTALGAGIGALFGGVGALPGAAIGGLLDWALGDKTQIVEDGFAPASRGPFTVVDSYGSTAITKAGDNLAASPNMSMSAGTVDLTPMIAAINQVKVAVDRLYAKDTSINMDGKKIGTTLTQGSTKLA